MATQIFVNLVVNDLEKTKAFFSHLGFTFNPQFTDENAACLVISDTIYAMLMTHESMKRFTKKEIADAKKTTEVLLAISRDSKDAVLEISKKAVEVGGSLYRPADDYGWMYSQAIEDLDGHIWEFAYMDVSKIPNS